MASSRNNPQTPAAAEARNMKMGLGPDYSKGKSWFPNIIAPYTTAKIPQPMLTNSPRLDQLIQNGKLMLSLEDAISLALENNLNITVQKFTPWIAETQILKAKAGGIPEFANTQQIVLGTSPSVSFDPIISGTVGWSEVNHTGQQSAPFGDWNLGVDTEPDDKRLRLQCRIHARIPHRHGFHGDFGYDPRGL